MIFLDTSAIVAAADMDDANNGSANRAFTRLVEEGEKFLLHSYVVVESAAVLQRRLGLDAATRFLNDASQFHVHWIEADDHAAAFELLRERGRRGLSLVDCASFVVMRRYGVGQALAFDVDFEREGFALVAR